ncbi:MAG TPA: sigma 54-interacting transcriptional regulator [Syntrophorhabdaceae bacterium]|nr:sigma 54-interacting transcriptional regulator [Syntrophorhabdaceae bacterium]
MADTKTSREIAELSLLFEISTRLGESLDLKTVLKPILQMTAKHMKIPRGTLTILNRQRGEIVIEEAYGLRPEEQAKGTYRIGEGITGRVIDTGQHAIIPRISEEPLFLDKTGSRKHLNKRDIAFICVPVKSGSEVIGALSADRSSSEKIALEEDARLLTIIASSISQAVRLRQRAQEETKQIREENQRLHDQLKDRYRPKSIVGNSKVMRSVYELIEQVSKTNATVLILGESGVGKERVAHAIHYSSNRSEKPFVAVNCAALPESLIESELFGHEKGAFTGATAARKGRFETADKGTIFLDEIGDLPLSVQTKLLRVLQEKAFERVGGDATVKADVRVITATNRDLETLMREGRFREDLYYRLNVFPILVPPLRERVTDITLLADHFIEKYGREHAKRILSISTAATNMLMNYHWPGNVRELENCIERAIILSTDGIIHSYHLPPSLQTAGESAAHETGPTFKDAMANIERELIVEELKRCRGNMAKAARALGITERMMGIRVAKHNIEPSQFK